MELKRPKFVNHAGLIPPQLWFHTVEDRAKHCLTIVSTCVFPICVYETGQ